MQEKKKRSKTIIFRNYMSISKNLKRETRIRKCQISWRFRKKSTI